MPAETFGQRLREYERAMRIVRKYPVRVSNKPKVLDVWKHNPTGSGLGRKGSEVDRGR